MTTEGIPVNQGEKHHCAKLTDDLVREARRLKENVGLCGPCIHKLMQLDISLQSLHDALSYRTWRHVR